MFNECQKEITAPCLVAQTFLTTPSALIHFGEFIGQNGSLYVGTWGRVDSEVFFDFADTQLQDMKCLCVFFDVMYSGEYNVSA